MPSTPISPIKVMMESWKSFLSRLSISESPWAVARLVVLVATRMQSFAGAGKGDLESRPGAR
ncbi:hypothetical protein D3C84_954110 [compost metagenome]